VSAPRRTREPAELTDADIAVIADASGLAPETAFDLLVMRRAGVYALSWRRRETLRMPIETAAREIGAALRWDTPEGPWTEKVQASTRRARLTALRLSRACGIG